GTERSADVGGANDGFAGSVGLIICFAGDVGDVHETRGNFVAAPGSSNAVFQHGGEGAAVKRPKTFLFRECAQPAGVFGDHRIVHGHLFIELHAHLENFAKVFLVIVEQLIHFPVADQNDLNADLDGLGLYATDAEWVEHIHWLNLKTYV